MTNFCFSQYKNSRPIFVSIFNIIIHGVAANRYSIFGSTQVNDGDRPTMFTDNLFIDFNPRISCKFMRQQFDQTPVNRSDFIRENICLYFRASELGSSCKYVSSFFCAKINKNSEVYLKQAMKQN